jgi:hypothetical protein
VSDQGTVLVRPGRTGDNEVTADVSVPGLEPASVYIRANVRLAEDATTWLPALLPLAMKSGATLSIEGAVDPLVVRQSRRAQEILSGWYSGLSVVPVETQGDAPSLPPADGVGCFFSGGVDSFHSALRQRERPITHLIFAHGFDIPIANSDLGALARTEARKAAEALGLPLIEISTDLRTLSDQRVDWQTQYHGAAMAAVAHSLADHVGHVLFPGSLTEENAHPWGTHPDLDPQWGGSRVTLVHDSTDVTRSAKVRALAEHQVALDHLRVCFKNPNGAYNCGRCEKCMRTMINLSAVGALERCKTLPTTIDPRAVRRMKIDSEPADIYIAESLADLESRPEAERDHELESALRFARRMGRIRRPFRQAGKPFYRRYKRFRAARRAAAH